MLKLYGFDVSNYYNMIKMALALKGVEFEAIATYPNQSPEYLAISPTGKVPALQTEHGVLVETNVILEYLDDVYPDVRMYPQQSFERARVKELVKLTFCSFLNHSATPQTPPGTPHGVPGDNFEKPRLKW